MTNCATSLIELLGGRVTVDPKELIGHDRSRDGDVVVLSGTLLEGFGNLYSDLDLYVIGHELPSKTSNAPSVSVVGEDGRVRRVNETLTESAGILLDVQYYTFRELDTLSRSLRTLYQEATHNTRIFRRTLHHEDEDLIHKLITGSILRDGTGSFDPRKTFDPCAYCFLKYRNEVGGYEEFRDLVGSWSAGDLDTCLFNTRGYLISQVSGMMFLAGSTNPRAKWFPKRLASLGPEYAELRDGVMSWLCEERLTDSQKRDGVMRAFRLIDLTYSHARALLGTSSKYFSAEEALAMIDREFFERDLRDRDTAAERRLRRRCFSSAEMPMNAQLESYSRQE